MTVRMAATDAALVSALQASASGDIIELTVTRDYTVSVAGIDCRPNDVTIKNALGIVARIKTGPDSNEGFRDCRGIAFSALRFASTKFWGGGNITIDGTTLAANGAGNTGPIYFRGNHVDSTIMHCTWTGSGSYGVKIDGIRGNTDGWVTNLVIDDCTFAHTGDDPIQVFGMRDGTIKNCTFSDVSSYWYHSSGVGSANPTNRTHADGIHFGQVDGCLIQDCTFDQIEWQGIISGPTGFSHGWTEHVSRNIVVERCTFSNIGGTFINSPGLGPIPAPYNAVGGRAIMIFSADNWTIKNCVATDNIRGAHPIGFWYSWDNNEIDGIYRLLTDPPDSSIGDSRQIITQGGNTLQGNSTTPVWGFTNQPSASKDVTYQGIWNQVLPLPSESSRYVGLLSLMSS